LTKGQAADQKDREILKHFNELLRMLIFNSLPDHRMRQKKGRKKATSPIIC